MRSRWTLLALGLVVLLAVVVLMVGASSGFPSTHWLIYDVYHDTLGLSAEAADQATAITRKSFHIPAYALLAALAWLALPRVRRRALWAFVIAVGIGVGDEILQSFQPGRTARWQDVLIDAVGALLGIWIVRRLAGRRRAEDL